MKHQGNRQMSHHDKDVQNEMYVHVHLDLYSLATSARQLTNWHTPSGLTNVRRLHGLVKYMICLTGMMTGHPRGQHVTPVAVQAQVHAHSLVIAQIIVMIKILANVLMIMIMIMIVDVLTVMKDIMLLRTVDLTSL